MALKKSTVKEILSKAGCDADSIDEAVQKILDGHVASIEALTEERDSLKTELEQAKADQKELADLKKNSGDIEALRKEYDDFKASVEAEKTRGKKESAFKVILKDCGIPEKHWPKIIKYSDVDGIELDEEGNAKNADQIRQDINNEWSDHKETTTVSGTTTPTPPVNVSTAPAQKTMKEIMAIKNTTERQAEIANLLNNQK